MKHHLKARLSGFALLLVLFSLLLSACGASSLENALESALKDRIQSELVAGEDLPLFIQYRNAVYESIRFHVDKVDEQKKTASVTFSYVSVADLIEEYSGQAKDAESFYRRCIDAVRSGSAKQTEEVVEMEYSGSASTPRIIDNASFLNILSGGSLKDIQDLISGD